MKIHSLNKYGKKVMPFLQKDLHYLHHCVMYFCRVEKKKLSWEP
jgi:hypothetical protein